MKLFLLALLSLAVLSAAAQRKKAPRNEFAYEPFTEPMHDMARAGVRTFRQIELTTGSGHILDTAKTYIFLLDAAGRILESTEYEYNQEEDKEKRSPPYDKLRNDYSEVNRIAYAYDAAGQVTSIRHYDVLPVGSEEAVYAALINRYQHDMEGYDFNGESESAGAARQSEMKRFTDSFLNAQKDDLVFLRTEMQYTYNEEGNLLTHLERPDQRFTKYYYTYNPDGTVRVQRSVYTVPNRGNGAYFSGSERHFTYTADGQPATIRTYIAEKDTGAIALDKHLRLEQKFYYNRNGDVDSMLYLQPGSAAKHISGYAGKLRTSYTILSLLRNKTADTASFITYRYSDTSLIGSVTFHQDYQTTERFSYTRRGLLAEHLYYHPERPGDSLTFRVDQLLWSYGDAAEDRATALRKEREQAAATARYERHAALQRADYEKSRAAEAKRPAPVPQPTYREQPRDSTDKVFSYVEQLPKFDGDLTAFMSANLRHPDTVLAEGTTGRVLMEFIVRRDGSITDIHVARSGGAAFDTEAVQMIMAMPKWRPGRQNGNPVSSRYSLPVTFRK